MKITFPMLLGLTFLVLKLTGYISWSWWWVTCPFWIVIPIVIVCAILVAIGRAFETPGQRAARLLDEYADALRGKNHDR